MKSNLIFRVDIERSFTKTVKEYLDDGYNFVFHNMSYGLPEVPELKGLAICNLVKGKEEIRISLEKMQRYDEDQYAKNKYADGVKLIVFSVPSVLGADPKVLRMERFYQIDAYRLYTTSLNDYIEIVKKRNIRYNRREDSYKKYLLPDRAKSIVLPFVRRYRWAKARVNGIAEVYRAEYNGKSAYYITVKGHSFPMTKYLSPNENR